MYLNKLFYSGVVLLISLVHLSGWAQNGNVGIGTSNPHNQAILDISSQDKGLLIPRLSEQQRNILQVPKVANPSALGLLIYNTTTHKFNFWAGNDWQEVGWVNTANTGTRWFDGTLIPTTGASVSSSKDGDYYLNTTSGKVYKRESGTWAEKISLLGQPGPTGIAGLQGAQGDTGSVWHNDTDTPTTNNVSGDKNNDYYLDTRHGNLYQKTAQNGWQKVANILGNQGQTGSVGPAGANGTQGNTGTVWYNQTITRDINNVPNTKEKDYYLDNNGNVYEKTATGWGNTPVTNLKGSPGTPGATGAQGDRGSIWFSGPGTPTANSVSGAMDKDYYLDNTNGNLFQKTGNTWPANPITTLKGAPGTGSGIGSKWYHGTVFPTSALANDYFLNTHTQDVYAYNGTTWQRVVNIKGTTGSSGTNGAAAVARFTSMPRAAISLAPNEILTRSFSVPGVKTNDVVSVSFVNNIAFPDNIAIGGVCAPSDDTIEIKFVSYDAANTTTIAAGTTFIVGVIR